MSTFKIIKKGANNFWHWFNNDAKKVSISDFEVVLDEVAQTFLIVYKNGANVPQQAVNVLDIEVIDETDTSDVETFTNVVDLRTRLVELGYTAYLSATGIQSVVAGTNVTIDNTDPANPIISSTGGGGTTPTLQEVTDEGNVTTNPIKINELQLYNNPNADYLKIYINDSEIKFDELANPAKNIILDRSLLYSPQTYYFPDDSGTIATQEWVTANPPTISVDADDVTETATRVFVTPTQKTAITHSNRSVLDAITESFTTALKSAYDSAVSWITTNGTNVLNHLASTSNPHNVTKSQVGLSNVDNTSDANKPISTATQTALNLKANLTQVGNLLREEFTFSGSQTFTLANNYGQVYSVEVQGQGALSNSQYTLVAPNQITINDTLDSGDYIVVIYSNAITGVQPYYSQAEVDALLNLKANSNQTPRTWKSGIDGATVANTLTITPTYTQLIPANTFTTGDVVELLFRSTTITNKTSASNIYIYVNSTPNLSGTPLQLAIYTSGATSRTIQMERTLSIKGSTTKVTQPTATSQTDTTITGIMSTLTIDWTINQHIIFAIGHTVADQTLIGDFYRIIKN